jgi:CheY-like chemotaxis protein
MINILLIEDDPKQAARIEQNLHSLFTAHGLMPTINHAVSEDTAYRAINEAEAQDKQYDFFVIDVYVPWSADDPPPPYPEDPRIVEEGMSGAGYRIHEKIRKQEQQSGRPLAPIVLYTLFPEREEPTDGATRLLIKELNSDSSDSRLCIYIEEELLRDGRWEEGRK